MMRRRHPLTINITGAWPPWLFATDVVATIPRDRPEVPDLTPAILFVLGLILLWLIIRGVRRRRNADPR